MNQLHEQKRALRQQLRQCRAALKAPVRQAASGRIRVGLLALRQVQEAKTVFCFISSPDEVHTHLLIDLLRASGKCVLVPAIPAGGDMLAARFPGWAALVPGQLGILTPVAPVEFNGRVDVCITPGLGFTVRGERLGYGRGYYDRWFAAHDIGCRIGVGYQCQLVDAIPHDETDVNLDAVLTEEQLISAG